MLNGIPVISETRCSDGVERTSSEMYWRNVSHSALSMVSGVEMKGGRRGRRQSKVALIDFESGYRRPGGARGAVAAARNGSAAVSAWSTPPLVFSKPRPNLLIF